LFDEHKALNNALL